MHKLAQYIKDIGLLVSFMDMGFTLWEKDQIKEILMKETSEKINLMEKDFTAKLMAMDSEESSRMGFQ